MSDTSIHKNLHLLEHPLIQNKLTTLRRTQTPTRIFRRVLRELGLLMGYEVTNNLPLGRERITTPLTEMEAPVIVGKEPVVVPILRAALGLSDGLLELLPSARVGHIGLYRDETTHRPVQYLCKLPELEDRKVILVDPMLATGHSALAAIDLLIEKGAAASEIRFLSLIAAPEGVGVLREAHEEVHIYVASVDERLNEHAFIVPGLGDAGDRLFGTEG